MIEPAYSKYLACYGEKTIEGRTYSKLIFFIDEQSCCLSCTTDGGGEINSVRTTEYPYNEADHNYRDAYRDVASYSTSLENLQEQVIGLEPGVI